jgi:holo-[acyl-carrier protein] synthase
MLGCGIDLVEVARVRSAIEKNGDHFVRRVYTAEEIAYCSSRAIPWPHWAARFAAKEAFYKALPPGTLAALVWAEIGVAHTTTQGAPRIELSGETASRLAGWRFAVSLSHGRELAIAQVLAEGPGGAALR